MADPIKGKLISDNHLYDVVDKENIMVYKSKVPVNTAIIHKFEDSKEKQAFHFELGNSKSDTLQFFQPFSEFETKLNEKTGEYTVSKGNTSLTVKDGEFVFFPTEADKKADLSGKGFQIVETKGEDGSKFELRELSGKEKTKLWLSTTWATVAHHNNFDEKQQQIWFLNSLKSILPNSNRDNTPSASSEPSPGDSKDLKSYIPKVEIVVTEKVINPELKLEKKIENPKED